MSEIKWEEVTVKFPDRTTLCHRFFVHEFNVLLEQLAVEYPNFDDPSVYRLTIKNRRGTVVSIHGWHPNLKEVVAKEYIAVDLRQAKERAIEEVNQYLIYKHGYDMTRSLDQNPLVGNMAEGLPEGYTQIADENNQALFYNNPVVRLNVP